MHLTWSIAITPDQLWVEGRQSGETEFRFLTRLDRTGNEFNGAVRLVDEVRIRSFSSNATSALSNVARVVHSRPRTVRR
jgi:hypothetical protein